MVLFSSARKRFCLAANIVVSIREMGTWGKGGGGSFAVGCGLN